LTENKEEYKEIHNISLFIEKLEKVVHNKDKIEHSKWSKYVQKELNLIASDMEKCSFT